MPTEPLSAGERRDLRDLLNRDVYSSEPIALSPAMLERLLDALTAELREWLICAVYESWHVDFGHPDQWKCLYCKETWLVNGTERHKPACIVQPPAAAPAEPRGT